MYEPQEIEKKWQAIWEEKNLYKTEDDFRREKYYVLDMFPYPSGEGLHVGHPKGYIATDIMARQKMMQGYNVLHPMGWDAFGLPAENYAIKNKVHPEVAVSKNIIRFKEQLAKLGFTYDWSREVNTTDPAYYKWTQWAFLQMFNKGLAYESYEPINWCPSCKTGLANEDLEDGHCERCGTLVEKKPMRQWVLKITDYAERLLKSLDTKILNTGDYVETLFNGEKSFLQMTTPSAIKPGQPLIERQAIAAIVEHWQDDSFIILHWKKVAWRTLVTGGVEDGQTPEDAARAEILEETGYKNLQLINQLDEQVHGSFFHVPKNENRFGHFTCFHFKLKNNEQEKISSHENEIHEVCWIKREEAQKLLTASSHQYIWSKLMNESFVLDDSESLLDWPESIKESQRNWIGRSEGAELNFTVRTTDTTDELISTDKIKVFTTRPDTLFGVTYLVLAPENELINKLKAKITNFSEVEKYVKSVANKTEIDRLSEGQEKTGVELKGIKAINPANNEEVTIWVADYVLNDYGTGAVMAVPAHDERDFEFAKKYNLKIKQVIAPETGINRESEVSVTGVCAIVYDPKTKKFAVAEWAEGWGEGLYGLFGGGREVNETPLEAIHREMAEESGLYDFASVEYLYSTISHYFNGPKKSARRATVDCFLIVLNSDLQKEVKHETHETFTNGWRTSEEILINWDKRNLVLGQGGNYDHWIDFMKRAIDRLQDQKIISGKKIFSFKAFCGEGYLCNSGEFNGLTSAEAKKKITKFVKGENKITYKLRDWVFSRQRYWGEPIPLIHCDKCGVVGVAEKDLPVILPEVEFYEPTGTGESPLANIADWVNVACPKCGGKGKRETNTMPQWAGSSWYYLRYIDPNNSEVLVDKQKEKYWSPVDMYVGGAEHATRHLIYARFWHKFLFDIGAVSYDEPFKRYTSLGLILGPDGRKMSKRWKNVINPDDMVEKFGADAFRIYEMFLSPFTQSASFLESGVAAAKSFLSRVYILKEAVTPGAKIDSKTITLLNQTIKKVGADINNFKFNTVVSALMILTNALSANKAIDKKTYKVLLQLLAPLAPHMAEDLWQELGNKESIFKSVWPKYDEKLLINEVVTIAVQVNGKMRDTFEMNSDASEEEIKSTALARPTTQKWIEEKEIKKIIVVKGKIINIVI